jgi:hypothetical protein
MSREYGSFEEGRKARLRRAGHERDLFAAPKTVRRNLRSNTQPRTGVLPVSCHQQYAGPAGSFAPVSVLIGMRP